MPELAARATGTAAKSRKRRRENVFAQRAALRRVMGSRRTVGTGARLFNVSAADKISRAVPTRAQSPRPTAWARRGAVKLAQTAKTCLHARLCLPPDVGMARSARLCAPYRFCDQYTAGSPLSVGLASTFL